MKRLQLALCMSLGITQVVMAQRATLVVTVGDAETNDFIRSAQVAIIETNALRRTDIVGQAHFGALPHGVYTVRARSLGYAPLETSVDVRNQDSVAVRFMMRAIPTVLTGVEVTSDADSPWLREFERRRRTSDGRFITSAQIRASMGSDIGTVVTAAMPGVFSARDPTGAVKVFSHRGQNRFGFGLVGPCQVEVFIDGVRLSNGNAAELPLELLGGIEYHTPATVPVQYKTMSSGNAGGSSACGTLLLWSGPSW